MVFCENQSQDKQSSAWSRLDESEDELNSNYTGTERNADCLTDNVAWDYHSGVFVHGIYFVTN